MLGAAAPGYTRFMCDPISIATIGAAVIGGGVALKSSSNAVSAQKKAGRQAEKLAVADAASQQRALNQANQKKPNLLNLFRDNITNASGGVGSTMLTGPGGVKLDNTLLGRSTLLGA